MKHRPGPGWTHWLLSPVHEHISGIRVHMMGTISLPLPTGERIIYGENWPHSQSAERWIKIAGGNRKRGLMMWALNEYQKLNTQEQPQ